MRVGPNQTEVRHMFNYNIRSDRSSLSTCSVAKLYLTLCNPMAEACQASLSSTIFWSLLKLMSVESVMLSNHLILCLPLLQHSRQTLYRLNHLGSPFLQKAHILQMNTYKDYRRRGKIRNIKGFGGIWTIELVTKLFQIFDSEFWYHLQKEIVILSDSSCNLSTGHKVQGFRNYTVQLLYFGDQKNRFREDKTCPINHRSQKLKLRFLFKTHCSLS